MEEEGIVSLWLGIFDSPDSLDEHLESSYSEDGDFEGSLFTRAYNIDFYDEAFSEVEYIDNQSNRFEDLLDGFSYDDVIPSRFHELAGTLNQKFNTVILLYNFRYVGGIRDWRAENLFVKYIGSVSYRD